jgi:hypothetical protein
MVNSNFSNNRRSGLAPSLAALAGSQLLNMISRAAEQPQLAAAAAAACHRR